ncbi:MAG: thiolase family protein [Chloroflexi bacterium]|nr:thiolase family protein [Chloroflexota bacterium]
MAEKVGIVSVAQTRYEASKPHLSNGELVFEVTERVLLDTGLKYEDQVGEGEGPCIDKIISCSEDYWQGRTISDMLLHLEMGGFAMDAPKVAADGSQAVYHGVIDILSVKHDVVLVVAHRKESETDGSIIENAGLDPIYMRPLGLDFLSAAALQARRYMHKYGLKPEQIAGVVVKNLKNARGNPLAMRAMHVTVADVLSAKVLSDPIRELDARPRADGACALILAKESYTRALTDRPVWITGIGNCYDAHYLGDRDLAESAALSLAAKRAYSMAGITNPLTEISLAEISEEWSYQELLWAEELGFCERGKAAEMLDSGITQIGGSLPINASGGLLSGVPSGVAGISRVAEAFLQLLGKAGSRQVADARTAVVQGAAGVCGQSQCVLVLDNR